MTPGAAHLPPFPRQRAPLAIRAPPSPPPRPLSPLPLSAQPQVQRRAPGRAKARPRRPLPSHPRVTDSSLPLRRLSESNECEFFICEKSLLCFSPPFVLSRAFWVGCPGSGPGEGDGRQGPEVAARPGPHPPTFPSQCGLHAEPALEELRIRSVPSLCSFPKASRAGYKLIERGVRPQPWQRPGRTPCPPAPAAFVFKINFEKEKRNSCYIFFCFWFCLSRSPVLPLSLRWAQNIPRTRCRCAGSPLLPQLPSPPRTDLVFNLFICSRQD